MQYFRPSEEEATLVGWGVRVMLLTATTSDAGDRIAQRLAGMGGLVEREAGLFEALSAVIDDPAGYGLFVMDCDQFGGLDAGHKVFTLLAEVRRRVPVILVSKDCAVQTFPEERDAPIILRAPLSAVALRVGYEHAIRDRMIWQRAA